MSYLLIPINLSILLVILIFESNRFISLLEGFNISNIVLFSVAIPLINIFLMFRSNSKIFSYLFAGILILSYANTIYTSYTKSILDKSNKIELIKGKIIESENSIMNQKKVTNNCRYPGQSDPEFDTKKNNYISCINKYKKENELSESNNSILSNRLESYKTDLDNLQKSNIDYWNPIKQLFLSIMISILMVAGSYQSVKELKILLSDESIKSISDISTEPGKEEIESIESMDESGILDKINELMQKGFSQRKISNMLNLSQSRVSRLIKTNRINTGITIESK